MLIPVTGALLLAAVLRFVGGGGGLVAALALYPSEPGLELGFLIGVGLLGVAALYRSRLSAHWTGRDAAEAAPAAAAQQAWWRTAVQVSFPSTIGLTVLMGIALALEPVLATVLAGFLAGLGFAALALAAEQALWERRRGGALYAESGAQERLWLRPRGLHRARGPTRIVP